MTPSITHVIVRSDEHGTVTIASTLPPDAKPNGYRKNLIKAGAPILAELERIDCADARSKVKEGAST